MPQNKIPWQAVGKISIAGYSRNKSCSGTLIAPDKVLTAAHCLMNARTQKRTRPQSIHFLAGVFRGRYLAHGKAKCVLIHPEYKKEKITDKMPFDKDLALVILKKKLTLRPIPLTSETIKIGKKKLIHASYSGDRRFALTAHRNCQRVGNHKALWLTDCDTHFGSSGGPILITTKAENGKKTYAVTAVMVGIIIKRYSIAAPIQKWLPFIEKAQCTP